MSASINRRYLIDFEYAKVGDPISDYATSYDTKHEAWDYVQHLARRALDSGMRVDMRLTDMEADALLLTMVIDGDIAYAMRPNQKSASGVTGFVVAKR